MVFIVLVGIEKARIDDLSTHGLERAGQSSNL